jgi:SAM-dependent methyltransferase
VGRFVRVIDPSTINGQADPRAFFREVGPLGYQIPQLALPVLDAVIDASSNDGEPRVVLDVGCAYGLNGALLRYRTSMTELDEHYAEPPPGDDVIAADQAFFAPRRRRRRLRLVGLDTDPAAIAYAKGIGFIDDGWAESLEVDEPSIDVAAGVADVGLIVCTDGIDRAGAATFHRLLDRVRDPTNVWLAVFVLRDFDYTPIATMLTGYGLATELVPGVTFPQRRFVDEQEQQAVIERVTARGLDPSGKEVAGWLHAECFITRPAAAVGQMTLPAVVGMA